VGFIDARARIEFFRICLAGLFFSITQNYSTLLAIVFQQSGHSLPRTGLLISVFAIPTVATALLSSAIVGRIGAMGTMRLAMVLTILGIGSLAFTRDFFWLAMLSRVVQGLGVGMLLPSSMTYVQSRLTRERFVYLVAFYSTVIPLATAIAPPIGEWTLAHYGANVLFGTAVLWCAVGLLLTFGPRSQPLGAKRGALGLKGAFRARFTLPLLAVVTGGALYGFIVSYLAPDMQRRGILLAYFFIPSTVALVLSRMGAMRRLQFLPPRHLVAGGLFVCAAGLVAAAFADRVGLAMVAGFLLGAGNSVLFPVVSAWVSEGLAPAERAGPQALTSCFFYLGIYATPLPQTFMVKAWGYGATEVILAGLGLLVALILALPQRKQVGQG
jgi:MFS family permease